MFHLRKIAKTEPLSVFRCLKELVYEREIYLEHEFKLQKDILQVHILKKTFCNLE